MDSIITNNIHSFSVYDLNTKFNDRCYVDWSKSNLISIVTLDGIYILKLQLDKQKGPFQIELIRNPTSKFKHLDCCNIGPTFDTMWQSLDSHQYMEVFLDPALLTNVPTLNLDLYPRRFRLAKWSPLVDVYPRQCFLATITLDYQLLIYSRKFNNTWTVQADLSREYDKLWTQLQIASQDLKAKENFDSICRRIHSLSFCNICWKETNKYGPILLATTITGDIVVWQANLTETMIESSLNITMQYDVKMIFRTSLEHISSMQLFDTLLIVCARDGQMVLYDLTFNFNDTENWSNPQQQMNGDTNVRTLNVITLPPTVLWHQDGIEVSDFFIQTLTKETFRIVLSKSTNICWSTINYSKKTNNEPASLTISETFSAIDGRDPDISLHQTPASWLKPAGDKKSVLIAEDGSFFQLDFVEDREDASPDFNAIDTGSIDFSYMMPRGLSTSPQGHLITMISCITSMYDPAKILAPSRVLLIPTKNDKSFFYDCMQKLLDENWLSLNEITSPMDVCDRIDYLRSIYPLLNNKQYLKLSNTLKENLPDVPKNEVQLVKFKIAAFLLMKLEEIKQQDKIMRGDELSNAEFDEKVNNTILLHNIEQILLIISDEQSQYHHKSYTYDLNQVNSLRNYFKFLEGFPIGMELINQHKDKLGDLNSKYVNVTSELCSICQSEIPFVSVKHGTCSNGHRFDRCARSLLIMNLQTNSELVCENCKRHYMTFMVWPSTNLWLCSFCQ